MVAPMGLGALAIVAGLALLFVPGIGILGVILMIVGVLLIAGGFAASRRRAGATAASKP
jgi:drug/metabolite transporter (DMT)-like permease